MNYSPAEFTDFRPRNIVNCTPIHRNIRNQDDEITPLRPVSQNMNSHVKTATKIKPIERVDIRSPYQVLDDTCPFCTCGKGFAYTNDGGSLLQCNKCFSIYNNVRWGPLHLIDDFPKEEHDAEF